MPRRSGVTAPSFASTMIRACGFVVVRSSESWPSLPDLSGIARNTPPVVVEARRQRAQGEADRGCAARSRAALEHTGVVSKTNMDLAVLRGLIDAG